MLLSINFYKLKSPSPQPSQSSFHASINSHAKSKALVVKRSTLLDGISLKSDRAVDYKNLRNLLASRRWEEADKETRIVMIQAADRVQEDYFDRIALLNFPCEDLRTIDALWVKASYGQFGSSVQNKIWQSVNGLPTMDSYASTIGNHAQFSERVGWREPLHREPSFFDNQWFNYEFLDFHLNGLDTRIGQLPAYAFFWKDGTSERNEDHLSLMIRFTRCSANWKITAKKQNNKLPSPR